MMSIRFKDFYNSGDFSQKEPITIDADNDYKIVPTEKENQAIQSVYAFAKWISPFVIAYGLSQAFGLKKFTKIRLVALPLAYRLLPLTASIMILPSLHFNNPFLFRETKRLLRADKMHFLSENQKKDWKVLHFYLKVGNIKIDCMLLSKNPEENRRWVLYSGGNGEICQFFDRTNMLDAFDANGLLFNYPGVYKSSGPVKKNTLVKAYQAALAFLEDQNGVGAKEIIGYGYSLGGGVQAEALNTHRTKDGIQYYFIKDRTFSKLSETASAIVFRGAGWLIKALGWEMDCVSSSKELKWPEIVIQAAKEESTQEEKTYVVSDDGVIPEKTSLMSQLKAQEGEKYFLPFEISHWDEIDYEKISDTFHQIRDRNIRNRAPV